MKRKKQGYGLGIFSGFLFGILVVPFLALGLISASMETLSTIFIPFFFPLSYVLHLLGLWSVILNGVLFAVVGFLLQRALMEWKKNEKIVLYLFGGVLAFFLLLLVTDGLLGRLGA